MSHQQAARHLLYAKANVTAPRFGGNRGRSIRAIELDRRYALASRSVAAPSGAVGSLANFQLARQASLGVVRKKVAVSELGDARRRRAKSDLARRPSFVRRQERSA
jgi:hypothetical protein